MNRDAARVSGAARDEDERHAERIGCSHAPDSTRIDHTAEATLTVGSARYHMVVGASGNGQLLQVLKAFEAAIAADDPAAIYPLMNSDIRGASSSAQFGQSWRDQESRLGRITSLQRVSVADAQTDSAGLTSAIATYMATVTSPSGVTSTQTFDAQFVLQPDGWKLWYTTTR